MPSLLLAVFDFTMLRIQTNDKQQILLKEQTLCSLEHYPRTNPFLKRRAKEKSSRFELFEQ